MASHILILSNPHDIHTDLVLRELQRRGASVVRMHPEEFPARISIGYRTDDAEVFLEESGRRFLLSEVRSVWYRRPKRAAISTEVLRASSRNWAASEAQHLIENVYALLEPASWINPLWANRRANCKLLQLRIAKQRGLLVPDTIVTNDAELVTQFVEEHGGRIIYKPVRSGVVEMEDGSSRLVFTTELGKEHVDEGLERIRLCPGVFQPLIEKRLDVRATVIDDRVFACAINSQGSSATRVDWRTEAGGCEYCTFELPLEVEESLVAIARDLGLRYGAFDLILTPGGEFVFLEVNPNGQWAFVEGYTGQPLASALATALERTLQK